MSITLEEITYGDTNYIQKLESWRVAIEDKIEQIDGMVGTPGAPSTMVMGALSELYDRRGILGVASYKPVAATLTGPNYNLTVAKGGYIYNGVFYQKTTSTSISLLGFTGTPVTLYVNLTGTGTPQISATADTTTCWQFEYNSSTHAVANVALYAGVAVLLDGDDVAACLSSTARAKTFTAIATRFEEIEVLLGKTVQTPASADTINVNFSLGGHVRILLDRPSTLINMSGAYDSQKCTLELVQDGGGGRAVTFGAEVQAGTDFTLPAALSTLGDKIDFLGFFYSAGNSKYNYVSLSRGY